MKKILLTLTCLTVFASAYALTESEWYTFAQGYRSTYNIATFKKSDAPSKLDPLKSPSVFDALDPSIPNELDKLISKENTRIFIASYHRQIILERYAQGWLKNSTPLGYSMTKSLTSLTVGKALCDGKIKNLSMRGQQVAAKLGNTSWGLATVDELLSMRSGSSKHSTVNGWQDGADPVASWPLYTGSMSDDYYPLLERFDRKLNPPGAVFQYNNFDTIALGLIIDEVTSGQFQEYFQKNIWQQVGSSKDGALLRSRKNQMAAHSGFSAAPEDWLRIGHFVMDEYKNEDSCFGQYLRKATTDISKFPSSARCYGYQIWTYCGDKGLFFFTGSEGQYLYMIPGKDLVFYIHQINESQTARVVALVQKIRHIMN
jgi:hypothetical protein